VKSIPLHGKDGVRAYVTVDDDAVAAIGDYRWHLATNGYARRWIYMGPNKSPRAVYMHRELLRLERGDKRQADHINGDKLDNRWINLRIVTSAENMRNRPHDGGRGRSRYRGVYYSVSDKAWRTQIKRGGRAYSAGSFQTEDEAAEAIARWRLEHDASPRMVASIERDGLTR
jgi:hypothetical protein